MKHLGFSIFKVIFIIIPLIASIGCAIPGLGNEPAVVSDDELSVAISSPAAGQTFAPGSEVTIQSTAIGNEGVARVELLVDDEVVLVDANADPQPNTPFIVVQPWTSASPGTYIIKVRAYNVSEQMAESKPLTVPIAAAAQAVVERSPTATVEPEANSPTLTPIASIQDAPTATPSPLSAPTEPPSAPTAPIPLPPPSVTPTPGDFDPTGVEPEGRFNEIWQEVGAGDSRLGYPLDPIVDDRDFARQYFEKGMMYWWDNPGDPDYIWVIGSPAPDLNSGTSWNRYDENWDGDEEYSCEAALANGDKGPIRGFGQLWCERPELQARLGQPREREAGSGGTPPFGQVQFFQGGVMLYNPLNSEVFVLFAQGDWQRFGY